MTSLLTECRSTLRLALPLTLSALAGQAMVTTDVLMVGRLGPLPLAASGLASFVYGFFLVFGLGIVAAVGGLLAQAYGARDTERLRANTAQAFWFVIAVGLPIVALLWNLEPVLMALGQDPGIAALAGTYLQAVSPALIFSLWSWVLRGLFATSGLAKLTMAVSWGGVVTNALLDYVLIYGHFGFPRLELTGSGLATTLVSGGMLAVLVVIAAKGKGLGELGLFRRLHIPDPRRLAEIARISLPAGIMRVMEGGMWAMSGIMIGWVGTEALGAYSIVMPVLNLVFMVPMGLGAAATVRVGNAHGAGDPVGVRRAGTAALGLALLLMAAAALLFWAVPERLVGLYLDPGDPASGPVLALAASLLAVAALFQLADGAQSVTAAALRGISDTKVPMWLSMAGYWVLGIPAAYALAFELEFGAPGILYGMTSGLVFMAFALTLRFQALTRPVVRPVAVA